MFSKLLAGLALVVFVVSCAPTPPATPTAAPGRTPSVATATPPPAATVAPGGTVARSDKSRLTGVAAPAADLTILAKDDAAFAFDLYGRLRASAPGANFMFSPHSISTALAMTYAGAKGNTATEMAAALHFGLPADRLHAAFNTLDQELAARGKGAQGKDGKGFRLNTVNAVWGQSGYKFLPDFLDTLALNYGAGLRLLDFARQTEPSRLAINQWVSDQTEARIKDLIPRGAIDASTALVLTNAIYFNAAWASPFDAKATVSEPFTLLDGKSVNVPTMKKRAEFAYAQGDGWQMLEMPYDGRELAMDILLPAAGQYEAFESALTAARLTSIVQAMKGDYMVDVSLPRWKFDSSFGLVDPLKALGMKDAFAGGKADFSGMDGSRNLFISAVLHKAFVAVDEAGTEAAAATAVIVGRTSIPAQSTVFKADRPFIFLIRDLKTGAVLFVGRVLNPGG
ncbi:MAG: serpin family protein [Chloroflexi bacterium]|nr:serpin family protein [Chloroflexota bacterium]